jgi:ATP-dependent Clp protease ATP-binding subunit ClpB
MRSIDSQIVFNKLSRSTLRDIVDLRLTEIQTRLDDRQIRLDVDEPAKQWLTEHGYSPIYGARPLNRLIQKVILEPLAMELISGGVGPNEDVKVRMEGENLVVVRNHEPMAEERDLRPVGFVDRKDLDEVD